MCRRLLLPPPDFLDDRGVVAFAFAARALRIEPRQPERARQATGMGGKYPLVAMTHSLPVRAGRLDKVSSLLIAAPASSAVLLSQGKIDFARERVSCATRMRAPTLWPTFVFRMRSGRVISSAA